MYAVIGRWSMEQNHAEDQDHKLHEVVVPMTNDYLVITNALADAHSQPSGRTP
jgi:hypothetical protein